MAVALGSMWPRPLEGALPMDRASAGTALNLSSVLEVGSSDPFSLNFKVSESEAKIQWTLGVAGFLGLSRTGQSFGLFKPNGTVPRWR